MKSTLIRTVALLMLAMSVPAFAAGTNPCSGSEAGKSGNQNQTKKEKKSRDQKNNSQQDKTDQEKEFDRVLQGMWG